MILLILLPHHAMSEIPEELQTPIQNALDELVHKSSSILGMEFTGPIAVFSLNSADGSSRFSNDFNGFVTRALARAQTIEIDTPAKLSSRLQSLYMDPDDLHDQKKRQAFYRSPQGSQLNWVVLLTHENRETEIAISMKLEQVSSGGTSVQVERDLTKTNSVFQYLGEPVPRTLYVRAPQGAQVHIADKFLGYGGPQPISVRLLPGNYNIGIDLDGYAQFSSSFDINGQNDWDIEIRKHDNSGAPVKAFLLGAILPGSSVWAYGSPKTADGNYSRTSDEFTVFSAGIFYVGLGVWAIDHFRDQNALTTASQERNDKIETIELGICLTGYVMNLIGSAIVGRNFAKDNRSLEAGPLSPRTTDFSLSELSRSLSLGLVSGPNGPLPALTFSRSF